MALLGLPDNGDANPDADFNGDGSINSADLSLFLGNTGFAADGSQPSTVGNPVGWAGYVWDPAVRLWLARHRWYDPELGRWVSRDPIGYGGGDPNLYGYVGGTVTVLVDPYGLRELYKDPEESFQYTGDHDHDVDPIRGLISSLHQRYHKRETVYVQDQCGKRAVGSRVSVDGWAIIGDIGIAVGPPVAFKAAQVLWNNYRYAKLLHRAKNLYPKKAGKIEGHHVTPKYLGGESNGAVVPLDAAYHQMITNAFRTAHPYGRPRPTAERLQGILREVYRQFPAPPGYRWIW